MNLKERREKLEAEMRQVVQLGQNAERQVQSLTIKMEQLKGKLMLLDELESEKPLKK